MFVTVELLQDKTELLFDLWMYRFQSIVSSVSNALCSFVFFHDTCRILLTESRRFENE